MIAYACPNCRQTLQSADEHAGMTLACPYCRAKVIVPSAPGGNEFAFNRDSGPRRKDRDVPNYSKAIFYLILGIFLFGLIGGSVMYLTLRWYPEREYESRKAESTRLFNKYMELSEQNKTRRSESNAALKAYQSHLYDLVQFCRDHPWMPDRDERLKNRQAEFMMAIGLADGD